MCTKREERGRERDRQNATFSDGRVLELSEGLARGKWLMAVNEYRRCCRLKGMHERLVVSGHGGTFLPFSSLIVQICHLKASTAPKGMHPDVDNNEAMPPQTLTPPHRLSMSPHSVAKGITEARVAMKRQRERE